MILKAEKKSQQTPRHFVPEVMDTLRKGQAEQLRVLKGNVAELKKNFSTGIDDSRIMAPLLMKTAANAA